MIRLLVRLPVVLALGLCLAWAAVLVSSPSPEGLLEQSLGGLREAFPGGEEGTLVRGARRESLALGRGASVLGEERSRLVGVALFASALHCEGTLRVLPVGVLLALAGVAAGLVFRERLREGEGYASPTAAGLARLAIGGGILWIAIFSFSPLPVTYGGIYLAWGILSLGGALYVANLPLRL